MIEYFDKLKLLFLKPTEFFKNVKKEKDYWTPLKFYIIISIIADVIGVLFAIPNLLKSQMLLYLTLISLVSGLILVFIIPFVAAGIIHLGVLIFKGKEGYYNTFKPVAYAMTIGSVYSLLSSIVSAIASWFNPVTDFSDLQSINQVQNTAAIALIAIIGLISLIHVLYAHVLGISNYQNLTTMRAFLSVILIPLILIILVAVLFGTAVLLGSGLFSGI